MTDFSEKHEIPDVEIIGETDKAYICIIEGDKIYIAKSQVDDDSEIFQVGDHGTLTVSGWLARKKGWI